MHKILNLTEIKFIYFIFTLRDKIILLFFQNILAFQYRRRTRIVENRAKTQDTLRPSLDSAADLERA